MLRSCCFPGTIATLSELETPLYIVALQGVLVLSGVARLQEQSVLDETAQLY